MAKKIYFPALQSDILLLYKNASKWLSNGLLGGITIIFFIQFGFDSGIGLIWGIAFLGLIKHIFQYYRMKQLEKKGRVLYIEKKKNERSSNIIYAIISFVLVLIFSFTDTMSILFGFLTFYYLIKYFFYLPSTIFIANDYELVIKRKRKYKVFDFSYPNRLRFVYNMISFDHPVNGKDSWKDINMDRDKMNEIRLFLANNFGNEMVLNPTTGLPYTI
jgi:hypothetical protein